MRILQAPPHCTTESSSWGCSFFLPDLFGEQFCRGSVHPVKRACVTPEEQEGSPFPPRVESGWG